MWLYLNDDEDQPERRVHKSKRSHTRGASVGVHKAWDNGGNGWLVYVERREEEDVEKIKNIKNVRSVLVDDELSGVPSLQVEEV